MTLSEKLSLYRHNLAKYEEDGDLERVAIQKRLIERLMADEIKPGKKK